MNSDILITGAAGFIGSNLTYTLLKKGFKITGVDNFSKYYSRKIKENNLKPLLKNKMERLDKILKNGNGKTK